MNILSLLKTIASNKGTSFFKDRFFLVIPMAFVVCVLTIVMVGLLFIQLLANQSLDHNRRQSEQVATILREKIAIFIHSQTTLLATLAQDTTLLQLFTQHDNLALNTKESELNRLFPDALRVRLLSPGPQQTEETTYPILGYAALAMLQETEAGRTPVAEIHLSPGGKRNIAMTRPVRDATQRIVGHILVQSALDSLLRLLEPLARDGNTVILAQEKTLKLYQKGNPTEIAVTAIIPGTRWHLTFGAARHDVDQTMQVGGLLGILVMVVVLVLLWIHYAFAQALNDDLATIVRLIKDLRNGRKTQYTVRYATVNGTLEIIQRIFQTQVVVATAVLHKQDIDANPVSKFLDQEPEITPPSAPSELASSPPALNAPETIKNTTPIPIPIPIPAPPAPIPIPPPAIPPPAKSSAVDLMDLPALEDSAVSESTPIPSSSPLPAALVELMDLATLGDSASSENSPATAKVTATVPAMAFSLPELSFTDADLSDVKPTNKSTITLPSASASAPLALILIDEPHPAPAPPPPPPPPPPLPTPSQKTVAPLAIPPEIFRAYDIRGVGDALTDGNVFEIGRAIATAALEKGQKDIVVARDGRLSSPRLAEALMRGILATGSNVIDIGQVPTPVLYFATHFLATHAGVMITASHNPPSWNGMKIVLDGETLFGDAIQKLSQRIKTGKFTTGAGNLQTKDLIPDYLKLGADIQLSRPLRLVVDCGNGVAGAIAPRFYRLLGCKVEELFCQVDGNFPNHLPDPSQRQNLRDLINAVKTNQADLGLALDGDGDRLVVVDGNGKIIWPDRLMMLFAQDFLSRNSGATIIFDVKSSVHLPRVIKKYGGKPLMWKTGHSLIKAKMKEVGALLAGELSGHFFFKERWFGFDDGMYAGARLLELLSHDQRNPSKVFADLPDAVSTEELRVNLPEGENQRLMKSLYSARTRITGADISHIDGLRADFEEGWGLVRASNTTPSLVFRFEAQTQKALQRIQDEFRRMLLEVGPGLKLPF